MYRSRLGDWFCFFKCWLKWKFISHYQSFTEIRTKIGLYFCAFRIRAYIVLYTYIYIFIYIVLKPPSLHIDLKAKGIEPQQDEMVILYIAYTHTYIFVCVYAVRFQDKFFNMWIIASCQFSFFWSKEKRTIWKLVIDIIYWYGWIYSGL